jgi:hypothetical protein
VSSRKIVIGWFGDPPRSSEAVSEVTGPEPMNMTRHNRHLFRKRTPRLGAIDVSLHPAETHGMGAYKRRSWAPEDA